MDHLNIARVLDAGAAPDGRPFFVMELVKGVPITKFCDERKLTPRQRLQLFVPVCQAIQHAHQKGVIHRDIKPSNVLVALYDERPVPKVIDFGVAKATGPQLAEESVVTGFGVVVGTPEYMSPEQANFNALDVDTRSDIYALGVLLYELLTGTTPVDRKSLGQAALLEVLRVVREVEVPRPSSRLSSSDALPGIAADRGTEPAKLSRLLRGELDWVLLKALEKDRARRFDTANGLTRDIQRYLADEVVEARPPSALYRARKFVSRNKGRVVAATLVLLAIVAGMVGTALGLIEANRQKGLADDAYAAEARRADAEATHRRRAERNLRLLGDNSSVLFDSAEDDILYQLFRDYVYTEEELAERDRPVKERIDDLEQALAQLDPPTASALRLRLFLALHYLHEACHRPDDERSVRRCGRAIELLEAELDRDPELGDDGYWIALQMGRGLRGRLLAGLGREAEALADYRRVLESGKTHDPKLALECLNLAVARKQFDLAERAAGALAEREDSEKDLVVRGGYVCALASTFAEPAQAARRLSDLAVTLFKVAIGRGANAKELKAAIAGKDLKSWRDRKEVAAWMSELGPAGNRPKEP